MSGAVEAIAGVAGDIVSAAADVSSVVSDLGTEFLSADALGAAGLAFGVPGADVLNFGAYLEAGSFAGNAAWVDAFNPSSIINSIPGVGDFGLKSITDSLPSLSSIATSVPSVSDFQGYVKTAQTAINQVAPVVQKVQNLAGYAGIQIPGTQILNQAAGAVNLASAGLNTASGISGTIGKVVKTAESVAGGESVVASVKNLVGGPTPVTDAFGLNILNDQQMAQVTKNATLINFLNDPAVQGPQNYDTAKQTTSALGPVIIDLERQVESAKASIKLENENIVNFQARLDNPDLTAEQRARLEEERAISYDIIARDQQVIDNTQPLITSTTEQFAQAQQVINATLGNTTDTPAPVISEQALPENTAFYDPETGTWSIFNRFSGDTIRTGLTEKEAIELAPQLGSGSKMVAVATPVNLGTVTAAALNLVANPGEGAGINVSNLVKQARDQQALREGRDVKAQASDWRVRLRLAPNSTYLYNAASYPGDPTSGPGLMAPLKVTDGVIFPYTPAIDTAYKANYEAYDLTHSNYRGYFYKNSYVDMINIRAQFTAQDTSEANYLLAVIHFFRSATKMFYGKDSQAGAPPPLVYLSGYGDFQFNEHPCVISQFNYQLPPDVDYIRAQSSLFANTNMIGNRIRNPIANNPVSYITNRLLNSNLLPGALDFRPSQGNLPVADPTYVPTKMEISISLLPMQSRSQVSNNFSVKQFANGNLLKGGYW